MTIALWIVLTPLCLWVALCAIIWIWYYFMGQKTDHSGDMGLAVIFMPIVPFVFAWHAVKQFFRYIFGE